jgi:hypothetical protein
MSLPDRVVCVLAAAEQRGRRERWLRLSDAALIDKAAIAAGVLLRFRWSEAAERELRELVALERECCSFAHWDLTQRGRELRLEVTAERDATAAVRTMFDEPPPTDDPGRSDTQLREISR